MLNLFLKLLGNWKLTVIVMAISALISGYAGWKVRDLFADHAEVSRLQDIIDSKQKDLEQKQKAATEAANAEIKLREANRKLNALLDNEIKNPAYRCTVPIGGLQAINNAVVQSNSGQPGAGMRESSPTISK